MKALILEDEYLSMQAIVLLLKKYCPDVKVLKTYSKIPDLLDGILTLKPDFIFLDIEINGQSIFNHIDKIQSSIPIIFTTAFDNYAYKAFRNDAIDYLLKPIDKFELIKAVEKVKLLIIGNRSFMEEKISLNTSEGLVFLKVAEILRIEAEGNYTSFILVDNSQITISKNIGSFQNVIQNVYLKRVHKSHIINLAHVAKYIKGEGGEVIMKNGEKVPIARDKKEDFLTKMNELK